MCSVRNILTLLAMSATGYIVQDTIEDYRIDYKNDKQPPQNLEELRKFFTTDYKQKPEDHFNVSTEFELAVNCEDAETDDTRYSRPSRLNHINAEEAKTIANLITQSLKTDKTKTETSKWLAAAMGAAISPLFFPKKQRKSHHTQKHNDPTHHSSQAVSKLSRKHKKK